jgi:3-oxoacyl-[acyl-carrier protein] reductase
VGAVRVHGAHGDEELLADLRIRVAECEQEEDVAHAASFFVSEAAGFVTGRRLVVDGGPRSGVICAAERRPRRTRSWE